MSHVNLGNVLYESGESSRLLESILKPPQVRSERIMRRGRIKAYRMC